MPPSESHFQDTNGVRMGCKILRRFSISPQGRWRRLYQSLCSNRPLKNTRHCENESLQWKVSFWRYSISRWKEWSYLGRVQQDQISPYYTGPAYVLSSDVKKPFKNEDVYIGMLVEKIGGVRVMVHRGFRYGQCKHIPGTISLHRAPTIECIEELFQEAMTERKEYELAQLRSARMLSYNVINTSQVHEHNQFLK